MTFDFIKKLFLGIGIAIFTCFIPCIYPTVAVSEISSVGYVHSAIKSIKNIDVPMPSTTEPKRINSVAYLMKQIDDANEILNGMRTTDYLNSDLAVSNVMATTAADRYIDELINKLGAFEVTVTGVNSFDFQISASGYFAFDWGDGTIDRVTKTNATNTTYSHTYPATGNYTIRIFGKATGYNSDEKTAAISFSNSANKEKMTNFSGGLGQIFSTLPSGANPRFYMTFYGCSGLTNEIPGDIFDGIYGAPISYMFAGVFANCPGLTGEIPAELFAGISGAPTEYMYTAVFQNDSGLTGSIPPGLFGSISGKPAAAMFYSTFNGCSGLTGSIPEKLFGDLSGAPADSMFRVTFQECNNLTGNIPPGLFGNISGAPKPYMFAWTFYGCNNLTGTIPPGLFGNLSGAPAEYMFSSTFSNCENLTGTIPPGLFGNLSGAPASNMFHGTFNKCRGLTGSIPPGLFGNISGAPAERMFRITLQHCSGLTGAIPSGLLGNLSGKPADEMFADTFYGCLGLTTIEDGIWDLSKVTDSPAENPFYSMIADCPNITSPSPSIAAGSDVKLWEHFPSLSGQEAFGGSINMEDYNEIPDDWREG